VFSLVSGLPSTTSARFLAFVRCFAGTDHGLLDTSTCQLISRGLRKCLGPPLYDSPLPCMEDLWLIAFSSRPVPYLRAAAGSPGSRTWCFSAGQERR